MSTDDKPDGEGDGSDRRATARAPIKLPVEYKRLNSFFADYTRNISKGGTFIQTRTPLPIGTEFLFTITAPLLAKPIEVLGVVTRIVPEGPKQEPGMGIRFKFSDDSERRAIEVAVESVMEKSLGSDLTKKLLAAEAAKPSAGNDPKT